MIRINQLKLNINHSEDKITDRVCRILNLSPSDILSLEIVRRSIDARKKPDIFFIYTVDVKVENEAKIFKAVSKKRNLKEQVDLIKPVVYSFPECGSARLDHPPIIIGMGPAGLFCGYFLALHGYKPIILERGKCVEDRTDDVEKFWESGILNENSNVQFGEGGAGTFSDGKLNTLIKDKYGMCREVLGIFVKFGADASILYDSKPHIGTDMLVNIVKNMRNEIIRLGGEVRFESRVTDILTDNEKICSVVINGKEELKCSRLVLAIGHSARDTFYMLKEKNMHMEPKSFAVGFRIQHLQSKINLNLYGSEHNKLLGAAPYKVTAKTSAKRGVYSFCMCPGGYVVNASSENTHLAINGMSYHKRDGENANSAIIVSVNPEDYGSEDALAGVEFQRELEKRAYNAGGGKIPVQTYGDFKRRILSKNPSQNSNINVSQSLSNDSVISSGKVSDIELNGSKSARLDPQCRGEYTWAELSEILPDECNQAFIEAMEVFGHQISGFDDDGAILAAVESRTSSPVRIARDEFLQSNIRGIYPCGEGAGYAGGIMSAAMDGIRVAEIIAKECAPL